MFDAEKNVITSILNYPDLIKNLVIPDNYFIDPMNNFAIKILKKQYNEYAKIDFTLLNEFYKSDFTKIKFDTFINYMLSLLDTNLISKENFMYYQDAVIHSYKEEQLKLLINKFKNNQITQEELIEEINELQKIQLESNNENLNAEEIFQLITSKNKILKTRFERFQSNANIQEHDLPIIAARPGIGKTAFMINLLEDYSLNYKCLYFNLEMTEKQFFTRLISVFTGINIKDISEPQTDYQKESIKTSVKQISLRKIKIVTGSQTIKSIKNQIIRESRYEHLVVFIDYIGLIKNLDKNKSLYEKITDFVKELRQISLDYNCTIFIAAQINRGGAKTKNQQPQISDLKESGELEQSGTTVIMLHNASPFKIEEGPTPIKLIIGKNRNGPTGFINMNYNKLNQRFDEITKNKIVNNNDWRKNDEKEEKE